MPAEPTIEVIECSVDEVAAVIRARTYSKGVVNPDKPLDAVAGGELVGTFTSATRPTDAEVEEEIEAAAVEVRARLGQIPKDEDLQSFARKVVAIRAAMAIELSYRPEETNPEDSAYGRLEKRFNESLAALTEALPDTSSTQKGIYSIGLRTYLGSVFPTEDLLP